MTKLYYSAGACSMSCVIAFEEMGLKYQPVLVDWDNPDSNLADLNRLNPLGVAPVCITDKGQTLTQNLAILEYYADQNPQSKLMPAPGTYEHAQAISWLSFAASDFHKAFSPLFALKTISKNEATLKEIKTWAIQGIEENLAYLDKSLAGKDYILGNTFTAPDCYLFVVTNWTKYFGISIEPYKNLSAYVNRIYARPAVQKVLKNSGLLD